MTPEAAVLQLSATLLSREITPDLLSALQEPGTTEILKQIEPSAGELLEKSWDEKDFEDAAVEFCRLFILNPAVPARAAAYFEKDELEIAGRIQFMLEQGFLEVPESFQTLAPDHVSILLLIQTTVAGEDAIQFSADNLTPWVPRFAADLTEKSKHPLYKLVGKLLQGL